jgi:hypothetical protein
MRGFSWAFGRTDGAHAQAIDSVSSSKAEVLAPDAALPRGRGVAGNLVPKPQSRGRGAVGWRLGRYRTENWGGLFFRICFGPDLFRSG